MDSDTGEHHAETVFVGGPILAMDDAGTRTNALAVSGGKIAAVGEAAAALIDVHTEVVDLAGCALLPGFIDPHMHASMVLFADWLDLSPMAHPSADEVYAALKNAPQTASGWVLGTGCDPSITSGELRLDRRVLDDLLGDRPVFVLESNGHVAYTNTAGLDRAGIDRDTPDPPTGRYTRGPGGELTGRLEESAAAAAVMAQVSLPHGDELVTRTRDLLWRAARAGVTLLHDCGIGALGGKDDLDTLRAALAGEPPVRYRGMLVSTHYDTWREMGIAPGAGDDIFRLTGIKAWADGSNQVGTGYLREPYLNTSSRGSLNYSQDDLADVIKRAHDDGWQIGVHANGDAAIDVTIEAYRRALLNNPRADHRHRIEHCSILHPGQIEEMARLGLSPSFLIGHIRWWGAAFRDRLLGADRADDYDPCASALEAGLKISMHSEYNVTPIEPLRYVADAVNRTMAENGEVLNPKERIGVEQALRAVTIDAAWQCQAENVTGSLEVGKYADLVILGDDPTAVKSTEIENIEVKETWLAGKRRYRS